MHRHFDRACPPPPRAFIRHRQALEEKKARDEALRREKAEKAEQERLERLRLKEEKARQVKEKGKELERGGFRTVVADAIWAAYRRSLELGGSNPNVGPGRNKWEK